MLSMGTFSASSLYYFSDIHLSDSATECFTEIETPDLRQSEGEINLEFWDWNINWHYGTIL